MSIHLHTNDIPADIDWGDAVAVDSESMGLCLMRDPLCLVQLSSGNGEAHIVQLDRNTYDAPNLKALMTDAAVTKYFHFARFDIAIMKKYLGIDIGPIYCTRTASKLARTYTDKHGLKHNLKELLNIDLDKQMQSSDWGAENLSEKQLKYAASDVLYLHQLVRALDAMLVREGRKDLAEQCFAAIPAHAALDLAGWGHLSLFDH